MLCLLLSGIQLRQPCCDAAAWKGKGTILLLPIYTRRLCRLASHKSSEYRETRRNVPHDSFFITTNLPTALRCCRENPGRLCFFLISNGYTHSNLTPKYTMYTSRRELHTLLVSPLIFVLSVRQNSFASRRPTSEDCLRSSTRELVDTSRVRRIPYKATLSDVDVNHVGFGFTTTSSSAGSQQVLLTFLELDNQTANGQP